PSHRQRRAERGAGPTGDRIDLHGNGGGTDRGDRRNGAVMTTDVAQSGRGLEIENLVVGYGNATVLHGLSLSVAPGEVVGVAGPNGAGKSTLLKVISGLLPRTADRLDFDGEPLKRNPVMAVSRGVVQVPEGRRMFANLTVEENLKVGAIGGRVHDF